MKVAKRRGLKRAKVALARKLAAILHRMWIDQTDFRFTAATVPTSEPAHHRHITNVPARDVLARTMAKGKPTDT